MGRNSGLQQRDSGGLALGNGLIVPKAGLHLTDVAGADHQHTKPALTDATADGQGQLAVQKHFVERQLRPLFTPGQLELVGHGFLIHTDTHGGNFKGTLQHGVPHKNIAVESPIVIIRGASVMLLAGLQLAANLHEEHGMVLGDRQPAMPVRAAQG